MRQFLNSLYVTTQGAWLAATAKSSMCALKKKASCGSPSRRYQALSASDRFRCSPFLMALCAEHGVRLAFLTENGRFLARVEGPVSGNVLLRRQYRNADFSRASIIHYLLHRACQSRHCGNVLLRGARDSVPKSASTAALEGAAQRMAHLAAELKPVSSVAELPGYEGEAAPTYFSVFDRLIVGEKEALFFTRRSRRSPLHNVNALVSFAYTLLTHDTSGRIGNGRPRSRSRFSTHGTSGPTQLVARFGGRTAPYHRRPSGADADQSSASFGRGERGLKLRMGIWKSPRNSSLPLRQRGFKRG